MTEYDLIVIGSGPGGYETAAAAVRMGKRTMIVERGELGGTCLNRGCIPTKALCRSAEAVLIASKGEKLGVKFSNIEADFATAAARKNDVVAGLRQGVATELKDVTVVNGEARFLGENVIAVNGEEYSAPQIIVATGARPAALNIPGAELAIDSDAALSAESLPQSIVIIGGGVIGMEFASIYVAFGVKVTVIEYCKEILPGLDAEVAKRLRMSLKRRGVTIVVGAEVKAIREGYIVEYEEKGKSKSVESEQVLMAVGRKAVVPEGLEALGVNLNRGFIVTDEKMATNVPGVYAVGDCNGRCMLAHAAVAQGRVALGLSKEASPVMPAAVFTHPECAMVGLTENRCAEQGIEVKLATSTYHANGKAVAMDETDGMVKIIVDASTDKILGCHVCGAHAADIVQEIAVAMSYGITANQLRDTVHIHPTLSELIVSALDRI